MPSNTKTTEQPFSFALDLAKPFTFWQKVKLLFRGKKYMSDGLRRWVFLNIYCRHIYRFHMKFIHNFGWHRFTKLMHIQDGQPQWWCQWCGERHIIYRKGLPELKRGEPQTGQTQCQTK